MNKTSTLRSIIRKEIVSILKEAKESEFEDSFALDQSKGGVDNSLNKVHRSLLKLQTEMNKLMSDWKEGKLSKEEYIKKRIPLQTKRNALEKQLY